MFRVRALSSTGDYTFGQGNKNFLVDSPAAVGQAVGTRLRLWEGEWYISLDEGTPWWQSILAHKNIALATQVIRDRILGTPFAVSIDNFSVSFNNVPAGQDPRNFQVTGMLNTAFGPVPIDFEIPTVAAPGGFAVGLSPIGAGGGLL
jgi:hypothetical protein